MEFLFVKRVGNRNLHHLPVFQQVFRTHDDCSILLVVLLYCSFANVRVDYLRNTSVLIVFCVLLLSLGFEQISLISLLQLFSLFPGHFSLHYPFNVDL